MIFKSYSEFFNAVKDCDLTQYPTLKFFIAAVNNIGVGCSCTKNARIDLAKARYASLPVDLTDIEKIFLKEKFGGEIEFTTDIIFHGKI